MAAAVARAFEGWTAVTSDPLPDPDTYPAPLPAGVRLALVHRAGAAQSELRIGHVALSRTSPDYHAALVANMVLGGQFVSRINMNLREDKGYTYGVRTAFEFRRAPGPFVLNASVQADATAEAVREAIHEMRDIRGDRPITRHELELGRASLTRGYPRNFETADQIARGAAQLALYGLPDDYFTTFVPRVLALDEDSVTKVAAAHIDPARLLTVVVGDRDKLLPSLRALEMGDVADISVT
jgi:predicted Zn-dependent peptidase